MMDSSDATRFRGDGTQECNDGGDVPNLHRELQFLIRLDELVRTELMTEREDLMAHQSLVINGMFMRFMFQSARLLGDVPCDACLPLRPPTI